MTNILLPGVCDGPRLADAAGRGWAVWQLGTWLKGVLVMGSMHGSGGCEGAWSAVVIRQI
jgi:hypothetical protein